MTASLLLQLKQAERRIELGLLPLLEEFELTIEQWRVMSALHDEPGQPMTALAENAVLPPASLTRHVDKLVERGLVLRRIHHNDRRRVVAALSPVGLTVASRISAEEQRIAPAAIAGSGNAGLAEEQQIASAAISDTLTPSPA
jgi:DNA-binding MarR family transcriptional regulator